MVVVVVAAEALVVVVVVVAVVIVVIITFIHSLAIIYLYFELYLFYGLLVEFTLMARVVSFR